MLGLNDAKARLQTLWRLCFPPRPKLITAAPTPLAPFRIERPTSRSSEPARQARRRLSARLVRARRLYEFAANARAALEQSNREVVPAATILASSLTALDRRLLDALQQRRGFQERHERSWQALHNAHIEIERPLEAFQQDQADVALPTRSANSLWRAIRGSQRLLTRNEEHRRELESVEASIRRAERSRSRSNGWRYTRGHLAKLQRDRERLQARVAFNSEGLRSPTGTELQAEEDIEHYHSRHAERVIRALELSPLDRSIPNTSSNAEGEDRISTQELSRRTQVEYERLYPLQTGGRPPDDPALRKAFDDATEKLAQHRQLYDDCFDGSKRAEGYRRLLAGGIISSRAEFERFWLDGRNRAHDALNTAMAEYKEVLDQAMAAGLDPPRFDTNYDIGPWKDHFEDGTVESGAKGWREGQIGAILPERIDAWRSGVPRTAGSDCSYKQISTASWDAESVAVGVSLIGGGPAIPVEHDRHRIDEYQRLCQAWRVVAEKEYKQYECNLCAE